MNPKQRKIFEKIMHLEVMDDAQVMPYLAYITGYKYCVAVGTGRIWGDENAKRHAQTLEQEHYNTNGEDEDSVALTESGSFYQIMPETDDDGFFDWYCDNRPNNQFFKTTEMAVLHFVFWWNVWQKEMISNN